MVVVIAPEAISRYVLAGGMSMRFGSDKALVESDGATLLQGVIDTICEIESSVTLVTGESPRYREMGCRVITDHPAGIGPLGGLNAALRDRLAKIGPGWVLIAGCDLVRPDRAWIDRLREAVREQNQAAVAFYHVHWEPLFALYHTALLPTIERQLSDGRRSLQALLDAVDAIQVDLPDGLDTLPQANTPEQLHQALRERGAA